MDPFLVTRQALGTHERLSHDDIEYALEVLSRYDIEENFYDYVKFLTYTNKTCYTGYFCLSFNDTLDDVIIAQETELLLKIPSLKDYLAYPELLLNDRLTVDEKTLITEQYEKDVLTTYLSFTMSDQTNDVLYNGGSLVNGVSVVANNTALFDECSQQVGNFVRDTINSEPTMFNYNVRDDLVLITDKSGGNKMYRIKGYRLIDLLQAVHEETELTWTNIMLIHRKFAKEYRMYRYYTDTMEE